MSVIILISIVVWHFEILDKIAHADTLMHSNLCGTETEITLEAFGKASAATIHLLPNHFQRGLCKLKISAPPSHVIYMQWADSHEQLNKTLMNNKTSSNPPCPLNVFLPENKKTAVWKGDPCSKEEPGDVDLLTPQIRITWSAPRRGNHTRGRKLILTAVAQGNICKHPGQHTCMRIGWEPVLCVSEYLLCDGIGNCPKGSSTSDEDDQLCQTRNLSRQSSWEKLAVELIKKFKPTNGFVVPKKWPPDNKLDDGATTDEPGFIDWKLPELTTKSNKDQTKTETSTDSVSAALSHYGPWGYLMLGMLICGTVLMFCGLWECCFRRPKPSNETITTRQQPTTVLILNTPTNESTTVQQPPSYDDLDQPPSYSVLFPHNKLQDLHLENEYVNGNGELSSAENSTRISTTINITDPEDTRSAGESSGHGAELTISRETENVNSLRGSNQTSEDSSRTEP